MPRNFVTARTVLKESLIILSATADHKRDYVLRHNCVEGGFVPLAGNSVNSQLARLVEVPAGSATGEIPPEAECEYVRFDVPVHIPRACIIHS